MKGIIVMAVAMLGAVTQAQDAGSRLIDVRADAMARQMCSYEIGIAEQAAARGLAATGTYRDNADRCVQQQIPEANRRLAAQDRDQHRQADIEAARTREAAETVARESAAKAAYQKRVSEPSFARARLTALLCYQAGERRKYQGRIDEQKRGARIGGVIDKEQVYEAQQEILAMDKLGESVRRSLKSAKIKPADCRKIAPADLEAFSSCIDGERNDSIDDSADESVSQIVTASEPCAAQGGF